MGTGDWANWQTVNTAATLKRGKNTVFVTGANGGGNIDHLKVLESVGELDEVIIEFAQVPVNQMLSVPIVSFLEDEGLFLADQQGTLLGGSGIPAIESAIAISDSLILVTFDCGFSNADPHDEYHDNV